MTTFSADPVWDGYVSGYHPYFAVTNGNEDTLSPLLTFTSKEGVLPKVAVFSVEVIATATSHEGAQPEVSYDSILQKIRISFTNLEIY
jgi:hypothetical protein